MPIKTRKYQKSKGNKSEVFNALRLKGDLIEDPRSVFDEKDQRTSLSVGRDGIKVDGHISVTEISEGEHRSDQILVLDGDEIKKRTAAQIATELGDIGELNVLTDDLSVATTSGRAATLSVVGGEGIDTTATGATVTIAGENASTSNKGVVELATTAETTTGTDTARAVTPDGLKDGFEGSANIGTVGALTSGSIGSGFGAIDNGSSNITTTGTVASGPSTSTSNTVTGAALTSAGSNDRLIIGTQTLADGSAGLGTQEYRMIATNLTETAIGGWDNVYLIDQQVGGVSKFKVDNSGNATFAGTGSFTQLTSGAVIWQYFPFVTQLMTSARGHYFRDIDDTLSPHEKWDTYDADMVLDYRAFHGFFCVPEACTLVAWHGKVANVAATADPTISVYHATPETDTSLSAFALAGSASVVSIGTSRVAHDFSGTCDVDLAAGDLVVPTIKHSDLSSQGYTGSITLKFITR